MPNPTDVTVLYTDNDSYKAWRDKNDPKLSDEDDIKFESTRPSHIKLTSYEEFQKTGTDLPHTLVIHGHSEGIKNTLGELTAQEIAKMLAAKYGARKSELKTLCLMACETSVIQKGQEASFATSLANELNILGFRDVIVHAPPAVQPAHRSILTVDESYNYGTAIRYYEMPPEMVDKFDSDRKTKKFRLSEWLEYEKIYSPKWQGFPDNYIKATDKYFASPVLQIQDNINQFYSKVWKELYDLFHSFGSQILNAKLQVIPDFQKLQQTYNELKELDDIRGLYQRNINEIDYSKTLGRPTSVGHFKGFLTNDLFSQCDKGLKDFETIETNSNSIKKSNTEKTLINPVNGKKTVVARELLAFSDECRKKMAQYQQLQSEVLENTQKLKTQLLSKVKEYNTDDLRQDKKAVMNALVNYLNATEPQQIKEKQEALYTAMHNNPNWNEGLISKRSRTAVESALEIMQIEDRPGRYTPKMR